MTLEKKKLLKGWRDWRSPLLRNGFRRVRDSHFVGDFFRYTYPISTYRQVSSADTLASWGSSSGIVVALRQRSCNSEKRFSSCTLLTLLRNENFVHRRYNKGDHFLSFERQWPKITPTRCAWSWQRPFTSVLCTQSDLFCRAMTTISKSGRIHFVLLLGWASYFSGPGLDLLWHSFP